MRVLAWDLPVRWWLCRPTCPLLLLRRCPLRRSGTGAVETAIVPAKGVGLETDLAKGTGAGEIDLAVGVDAAPGSPGRK